MTLPTCSTCKYVKDVDYCKLRYTWNLGGQKGPKPCKDYDEWQPKSSEVPDV